MLGTRTAVHKRIDFKKTSAKWARLIKLRQSKAVGSSGRVSEGSTEEADAGAAHHIHIQVILFF